MRLKMPMARGDVRLMPPRWGRLRGLSTRPRDQVQNDVTTRFSARVSQRHFPHVVCFIYVHIYVYVYTYIYMYICVWVCVYIYIHTHIHMYVHTYTYIYLYVSICIYLHTCMYIHICIHIDMLIYIRIWCASPPLFHDVPYFFFPRQNDYPVDLELKYIISIIPMHMNHSYAKTWFKWLVKHVTHVIFMHKYMTYAWTRQWLTHLCLMFYLWVIETTEMTEENYWCKFFFLPSNRNVEEGQI